MESPNLFSVIRLALEEDCGRGDLTALAVPPKKNATAKLVAKTDAVLSGLWLVPLILQEARSQITFIAASNIADATFLKSGTVVGTFSGNARELLTLERTILNFLQRSSGIATLAHTYVQAIREFPHVKLLDTRKTAPAMRLIEKRAVKDGGAHNHRFALDSGVLVKENHIRAAGGITAAMQTLAKELPHLTAVQVEVTNQAEAEEAIRAGAKMLLLDNFSPDELTRLVPVLRQKAPGIFLEASGGVNLQTVRAFAATGVDAISVGAFTHSAPAADLSLLFDFT